MTLELARQRCSSVVFQPSQALVKPEKKLWTVLQEASLDRGTQFTYSVTPFLRVPIGMGKFGMIGHGFFLLFFCRLV